MEYKIFSETLFWVFLYLILVHEELLQSGLTQFFEKMARNKLRRIYKTERSDEIWPVHRKSTAEIWVV